MTKINLINLDKGVMLGLIKNKKFKSNLISIYFERNIKKEEATKISLLSNLLSIGSEKYPSMKDISIKLDDLYGMTMNVGVSKHGEKSLMYFKFLSIADKYVDSNVFEDSIDFIYDLIGNPLIVDNGLNPKKLDLEKENLKVEIESLINDKRSYANIQCVNNMCENENYSVNHLGYIEDLEYISSEEMYEFYLEFIKTSKIFIFIEGDFDSNRVEQICKDRFVFQRGNIVEIKREEYKKEIEKIKYIKEDMGNIQGKLVIGYRNNVAYEDYCRYYSLLVANSILGGGPHSKLFNNVREKESMCYYASTSLEKCKGILLINSGIEIDSYDRALELIRKEVDDLKTGNISEIEIDNAKSSIINALKSSYDSVSGESEFVFNQYISGTNLSLDEILGFIESVDKESIVDSVKKLEEDTVYFLK
ncbi:EF-P 5-aminopentanol modification-associated protein YfmF [Peptostreptococcus equinus]|uniref:Pitrilysin family protein n=1 Tax=Peptostreptococcus equinus TaxID=3003601 RepID=A0ABY7JQG7_9FIRM|nr:pitrilysin family protein [Peptostreptococcus sp. CBA3647]WAW15594.1 pitrilysin family protein [Peptostreptococcus sp. CBA3647]